MAKVGKKMVNVIQDIRKSSVFVSLNFQFDKIRI